MGFHNNVKVALPGDHIECSMKLHSSLPLKEGTKLFLREEGLTVAIGRVTTISEGEEQQPKVETKKK